MRNALREHPVLRTAVLVALTALALYALALLSGLSGKTTTGEIAEAATLETEPSAYDPQGDEDGRVHPILFTDRQRVKIKAKASRAADDFGITWGLSGGEVFSHISYADGTAKPVKCREVYRPATLHSFLGTTLAKTRLQIRWCWNGNKITDKWTWIFCDITGAGSISQWHTESCTRNGFFKQFQGSAQGAYELRANAHYQQQAVGWVVDNEYHRQKICVFRGGGATTC